MNDNSKALIKRIAIILILHTTITASLGGCQNSISRLENNNGRNNSKKDDKNQSKVETISSEDKADIFISEDEVDYQKLVNNYETSATQSPKPKFYDTEKYYIVYSDGKPQLCRNFEFGLFSSTLRLENNDLDIVDLRYKSKTPKYNSENMISSYAIIPCTEIVSLDTFDDETHELFSDTEKMDTYLDEKYPYPITYYVGERIGVDLQIFKFTNSLTNEEEYHIGYKIYFYNENEEIPYIYDIKDNKNYRMPDVGTVEAINISNYWEEDTITANEAEKLLNQYISDNKTPSRTLK